MSPPPPPPGAPPEEATPEALFDPALRSRFAELVEVGRGGMGRVFRAFDRELERYVALKVLSAGGFGGGKARERFLEEGRICSQLEHPNIVRLYDFAAPELYPPYMIFEFIEGESLEVRLRRGQLPGPEALDRLIEIAAGLAAAHEAGIVHRDLKPENVLLERGKVARVADFGLAKERGSSSGVRTRQGVLLGTPPYMAPEYIQAGTMGPSADLYALGIMAFQLLTGTLPYDHEETVQVLRMHLKQPIPDPRERCPGLADDLAAWIQKAMAKDPAERFASVGEFSRRLERHADRLRQALLDASGSNLEMPLPEGGRSPRKPSETETHRVRRPQTVTGILGDPVTPQGRRRAAAVAAPLALGALVLWGVTRRPMAEARNLQVHASPQALRARWEGRGELRVQLRDAEGAPLGEPRPPEEPPEDRPATHQEVRLRGLAPGSAYRLEVVGPGGELLQAARFETPHASALPRPELRFHGQPATGRLLAEGSYPFALTWGLEVRRGGSWVSRTRGGDDAHLSESHAEEIPELDLLEPVRLRVRLRPAGSGTPTEFPVLQGESALERRVQELAETLEARRPQLGLVLEQLQEKLRDGGGPDPFALLARHGFADDLEVLLGVVSRALSDPGRPLEEKLRIEGALVPLLGLDVLLRGHGRPPATPLRRLRQEFLPFGRVSTLEVTGEELGPPWGSQQGEDRNLRLPLLTRSFLESHAPGGKVREIVDLDLGTEAVRQALRTGRRVEAELDLEAAPQARRGAELVLDTRNLVDRHFLWVEINGHAPILLRAPLGAPPELAVGEELRSVRQYYRIPVEQLRLGRNRLSFRVDSLAGTNSTMMVGWIYRIAIRG